MAPEQHLRSLAHTERDARVRAVATEFLRLRPVIVGPFLALTLAVFAATGAPLRQVIILGAAAAVFMTMFLYERRAGRTRIVDGAALLRSLSLTLVGIGVGSTATGALASPLLPMLLAPVGVGFAAFGRSRRSAVLLALLVAVVAGLFVVSPPVIFLALREDARRIVLAAALVDSALLLRVGVASLAAAHGRAAETLAVAGDELVRGVLARTRALETMNAKVAHEVKNPLAAMRGIVEVMLESADDRAKRRLSVVATEIERATRILDDYRSMKQPLEALTRSPCDVVAVARSLVTILEPRAMRAGVELVLEASRPHVELDLDRDRIVEALLNVLLNALDATPAGGRVSLAVALADGGTLELRVVDTGVGMDRATLAKVGTPFFSQKEGGTGLGVALARQVAEQHGGTLSYESVKGTGTTALLRIPSSSGAA